MQKYNKFIIAIVGAVLNVVAVQFASSKYAAIAIAIATALGVYTVPNSTTRTL